MSSAELNELYLDLELMIKDYSEVLINELAFRDELEYEKELKVSACRCLRRHGVLMTIDEVGMGWRGTKWASEMPGHATSGRDGCCWGEVICSAAAVW